MPATPIQSPASYVPSRAAAYADVDGTSILVSNGNPLPVTLRGASTAPLNGSASVSGSIGPFMPAVGSAVVLELSGTWTGLVKVMRSTNGGATKSALTVAGGSWAQFSGNCCEPVWEESEAAATLYLDVALTSGTLTYRIS
jgi:hypothetical protein